MPASETQRPTWLEKVWPAAVLAALGAGLAARSWRKWPDIIVDFGNELYVPWRLTAGNALYRDLFWVVGPASQNINATLFRLFGVSLTTLIWANLAILAAITTLIYVLFRRVGSRWAATVVCVFFLVVFAMAQYSGTGNYNYVCPYRHEMTHGMLLCLLQIYSLSCFSEKGRSWAILLAGVCSGLLASMKIELFVASLGVCTLGSCLLVLRTKPGARRMTRVLALFMAGAATPVVVCLALLSIHLPVADAARGYFRAWTLALRPELSTEYPLFAQLMGIDSPLSGVLRVVLSFLALVLALALAIALDVSSRPIAGRRTFLCGVLGALAFAAAYFLVPLETWLRFGFPLPLFVVCAASIFVRGAVRSPIDADFQQSFVLALWSTLSGCLLLKMLLNVQLGHYGFVLAMPATLLLVYCGIGAIPAFLRRRRGTGDVLRAVALGVVAAWMAALWQRSDSIYARKTVPFGSGGDVTYHDPDSNYRSAIMPVVLANLRTLMPGDATLMVLPYGVQLNYLLREWNPTPYFLLTPWEMTAAGGEREVLRAMQDNPPDFIVLIDAEIVGHGFTRFGQPGYGAQIVDWIKLDYELAQGHVGTDQVSRAPFRVLVFARRSVLTAQASPRP